MRSIGRTTRSSPFLPTIENDGIGPTTGTRMERYAAEAGPLALRASRAALAERRLRAGCDHAPGHRVLHRFHCSGGRSRID